MADERTFGFNRDDASELIQMIGSGEGWFPEIKPRGGVSAANIRAGIVRARVDAQFYEIELGTLPRSAFGNHDLECLSCDPCTEVYGSGTSGCGLSISAPDAIVQTNGTLITAYDPFSDKIPLVTGTDCVVAKLTGSGARYGNYGNYGDGDVWVVLTGYHEHIVQYRENGECCGTGGEWVTTSKTPIILIGHECDDIPCEPCP